MIGSSQTLRFKQLVSSDGISQSEVYTFLEDKSGFMWIGTLDGLNRYDGYSIEVFNTNRNDPHSLRNNTIRSLAEDQQGRIWIGTDDGLNMYNPKTELIYQIEIKPFENNATPIWSILVYDDYLLLGTQSGLWRTRIKSQKLKDIESGFQQITNFNHSNSSVRSVIQSNEGGIWVLTPQNFSRIVFQYNNNEPVVVDELSFTNFSSPVSSIEDHTGNLWIASSRDGLVRYNPQTKQSFYFTKYETAFAPSSQKCSVLEIDKLGNLWIGTLDKGISFVKSEYLNKDLILFESIKNEHLNNNSLNSNLIFSLYVSQKNQVWVGTIGSGINIYNPEQKMFEHFKFHDLSGKSPISNFIRSVYIDNQNRIWAGTHNNGLFLLNRDNEEFQKLGFGTQPVFFIQNYKEDKNLICTGEGISLVTLADNKLKILSNSNINNSTAVFNVVNSKPDIYWYASFDGLVRANIINDKIEIDKIYTTDSDQGISNNNCRVLFYDKKYNELLVGTEGGGLNLISLDNDHFSKKIEVFRKSEDPNSLSNNYVRSIIKDSNQNVWIGTYEGLNKMVHDSITGNISFKTYTKKNGLPNNMIHLIIEDDNHCLWIGTNGGLSKYIPQEDRFINYTVNDGIQSNEFSEHTAYKTPDGEIILGGINGINTFYPDQIKVSSLQAQTTITGFYLLNKKVKTLEKIGRKVLLEKSITLTDTILLLPKQNNIGFDFSAMIFPNAEKIQYAYKLEGFDEDWNFANATNRNANYTNLRHGKYTFKVKSTNTDGIWENYPREIFVHLQTPFRYTWFAYVLYFLVVVLLFIYFSHYTIIRYTTKKKMLLEKNHNEKLHELDELRTKFFINISHDLRTPLTLIGGPLDSILQNNNLSTNLSEKLRLIKRNVKRLNYLVEQLLDVRKAESGKLSPKLKTEDLISFTKGEVSLFTYAIKKKGLDLQVKSEAEEIRFCFDAAMISKVYFNVLSNALKYTDTGRILIDINKVDKNSRLVLKGSSYNSFVEVKILDSGKGISDKQISRVFDRFYQDQSNEGRGYGIGLSHSKELVEAHQGFIDAESLEGKGTTIRFFLPDIEVINESEKIIASSTEDMFFDADSDTINKVVHVNNNAQTILLVEDNVDMRSFIKSELEGSYNVVEAGDGLEGLEKAEAQVPDLIVSDIMMPNMDGIEFCKLIKSNVKTSHIPVILLTAKVDLKSKYEGIETGADDYIPKPFEMEYLILRTKNLLQSREQLRIAFQKSSVLEPSAVTVTSIDEKFLSSLIEAIEEGIPDSNFSINSLESDMGMSHSNFYRKVKNLTGQSGQELLLSMRLKRARQIILEKKGLRVAEVAYMVGFTNAKYFSKCFKETFGCPPSELMK